MESYQLLATDSAVRTRIAMILPAPRCCVPHLGTENKLSFLLAD